MYRVKIFFSSIIIFFTICCKKNIPDDDYIASFPPTNKICFVGNSLTYWGDWIALSKDSLCKNYGIGGNTTNDILKRISPIVDENPCAVFLMVGINDIRLNYDINVIKKNISAIIKSFKRRLPYTQIYLQSILPINPDISDICSSSNIQTIIEMNVWMQNFSDQESITFINLYPFFCNQDNKLRIELTTEGLHLSEKGYEIWADCLKPYLHKIRQKFPT